MWHCVRISLEVLVVTIKVFLTVSLVVTVIVVAFMDMECTTLRNREFPVPLDTMKV